MVVCQIGDLNASLSQYTRVGGGAAEAVTAGLGRSVVVEYAFQVDQSDVVVCKQALQLRKGVFITVFFNIPLKGVFRPAHGIVAAQQRVARAGERHYLPLRQGLRKVQCHKEQEKRQNGNFSHGASMRFLIFTV